MIAKKQKTTKISLENGWGRACGYRAALCMFFKSPEHNLKLSKNGQLKKDPDSVKNKSNMFLETNGRQLQSVLQTGSERNKNKAI